MANQSSSAGRDPIRAVLPFAESVPAGPLRRVAWGYILRLFELFGSPWFCANPLNMQRPDLTARLDCGYAVTSVSLQKIHRKSALAEVRWSITFSDYLLKEFKEPYQFLKRAWIALLHPFAFVDQMLAQEPDKRRAEILALILGKYRNQRFAGQSHAGSVRPI